MIIGGILVLLSRKVIFSQKSFSYERCSIQEFDKPWIATLFMSIGLSFSNIIYKLMLVFDAKNYRLFTKIEFRLYLQGLTIAILDIIYSTLYSIAIVLIKEQYATLFRFVIILFTACLRRVWLKEKLLAYSYTALVIVTIGVVLSSISVIYDQLKVDTIKYNATFFIALTLQILAQLALSIKTILEEQILHQNDVHPTWFCGVIGIYETVIILFMVYPIVNFIPGKTGAGLSENFCDAIKMIGHSKVLIIEFVLFPLIELFYNVGILGVIFSTSGIHKIVFEMVYTSFAWFIELFIYYAMKGNVFGLAKDMGAKWDKYSPMRLVGIVLIFIGSLLYSKTIKCKCYEYEQADTQVFRLSEVCSIDHEV
ncbi:hypothetical protein TVAG_273440 [Trichomonas vaginalis G3]|uniref:Integral membrane protein n=1 Tax=Trichomonas vaginalis (strain ATCC PRA-98 / G3) TaxID=412133 RepID=A2EI21_TRIV3|nr:negative regulation of mitochondrial outer membrane permeabilization protein [Trichomonas vaginalis G3]EAY07660.1 hypothetical protein TVAG_273440 [Trichomonas vaginalis G3]KAI5512261.1 negative regulation of mitochondrial outer membrane permeabilization protein [Trichomonas vaginalis G3]|eukprot:XP_001319883.1 hypothetical protein [Trichomonas vaginalis G3]